MSIIILANNPKFLKKYSNNKKCIDFINGADLFVKFKFKSHEYFKTININQCIYFRANNNKNTLLGYDTFINEINKEELTDSIFLINDFVNIKDDVKKNYDLNNIVISMNYFDIKDVVDFVLSKDHIMSKIIKSRNNSLLLSSGFIIILYYALLKPNEYIYIMGFYSVKEYMKGTKIQKYSYHMFDCEKNFIEKYLDNVIFINDSNFDEIIS